MENRWLNDKTKGYPEALALYRSIVRLELASDWVHYSQLLRAAGSVVASIAEEGGRFRGKPTDDTARFYAIARGSLHEVGAFLELANIDRLISDEEKDSLTQQCISLSGLLYSLVRR